MKHDTSLLHLDLQLQAGTRLYCLPTDVFLSDTAVPQKEI